MTTHQDTVYATGLEITGDGSFTGDLTVAGKTSLQTINLDPDATPPASPAEGDRWWADGVSNSQTPFEDVIIQDGLELQVDIRSEAGALSNGEAIYTTGTSGTRRLVGKAQANNAATAIVLGLMTHDIGNNSNGRATTFGLVRDVDTTGAPVGEVWASGEILYLSPDTAGALTNVMPDPPNQVSPVGYVGRVHASNGDIQVNIGTSTAISNGRYVVAGYGEITVDDGSNTEAITTTPAKLGLFVNNGLSLLTTPDAANDRITVSVDGVYKVFHQSSFSFSIGNVIIEAHIRINQAEQRQGFHRKIGTAGDVGSASCSGLYSLTAGDEIEVYYNTVSGSGNITVVDAQLIAHRIG